MEVWREGLLWVLVLVALSLTAGGAAMMLHGVLLRSRLRCPQPLLDCVPLHAVQLTAAAGAASLLLFTLLNTVPWDVLGVLMLLVTTAPALLTWLGPPDEHVQASRLCQIGRGSAYSHYNGYLRLMRGEHGFRRQLQKFRRSGGTGFSSEALQHFFSDAVVVLAPTDGGYPDAPLSEIPDNKLLGVSSMCTCLPSFEISVGGSPRSYGGFSVHEVTSSDGTHSAYVALDKVGTLGTLRKLCAHAPANLKPEDCFKQMEDMMDELQKIISNRDHLSGEIIIVRYKPGDHVGDKILEAMPVER